MPQIEFNGQQYQSLDAMPPDVRRAFDQLCGFLPDANANGIPDVLEGSGASVQFHSSTRINVNGRDYASVDEMPADVRRQYESFLSTMAGGHPENSAASAGRGVEPAAVVVKGSRAFQFGGGGSNWPLKINVSWGSAPPQLSSSPTAAPEQHAGHLDSRGFSGIELWLTLLFSLLLAALLAAGIAAAMFLL